MLSASYIGGSKGVLLRLLGHLSYLYCFSIVNLSQLLRISNPFPGYLLDLNLLLSKLYCYLIILLKLFPSKHSLLFSLLSGLFVSSKLPYYF
jgi:hypothetical protein